MFKDNLVKRHCRYYQIGGVTIQVEADLPITEATFQSKFKAFEVDGPGEDMVSISHHFSLPDLNRWTIGEEIYRRAPWAVYRRGSSWIYIGFSGYRFATIRGLWFRTWCHLCSLRGGREEAMDARLFFIKKGKVHLFAVANHDHSRVSIYHKSARPFRRGNLYSLTLFPTDQIVLARVLAEREACYIHASGAVLDGRGLLFVGHSNTGKTTMVNMLKDNAQILCDDRMIVRRWQEGFKIHGTWSHGDVSEVSPGPASLRAILFLEQAQENRVIRIDDKQDVVGRLLACVIKPLVTGDWWDRILSLVDRMAHGVPCYCLHFDKSGTVVSSLRDL